MDNRDIFFPCLTLPEPTVRCGFSMIPKDGGLLVPDDSESARSAAVLWGCMWLAADEVNDPALSNAVDVILDYASDAAREVRDPAVDASELIAYMPVNAPANEQAVGLYARAHIVSGREALILSTVNAWIACVGVRGTLEALRAEVNELAARRLLAEAGRFMDEGDTALDIPNRRATDADIEGARAAFRRRYFAENGL